MLSKERVVDTQRRQMRRTERVNRPQESRRKHSVRWRKERARIQALSHQLLDELSTINIRMEPLPLFCLQSAPCCLMC